MFYKMKNNLCPNYLSSLVPPNIGSSVRYNLRNVSDIRTVHANTQLYYNSFLPSAIREWNDHSRDIQDSSTVASFKTRLNSNIALNVGKMCKPKPSSEVELPRWNRDSELDWK